MPKKFAYLALYVIAYHIGLQHKAHKAYNPLSQYICDLDFAPAVHATHRSSRVPTSSGNHGKSQASSMYGKIMEFEKP